MKNEGDVAMEQANIDYVTRLIKTIKTKEGADYVAKRILALDIADSAKTRIRELWRKAVDPLHCNEYYLPVEAHLFV